MIDYSPLWKTMKECGISQYTLINRGIDKHTLDQLRKNQSQVIVPSNNSGKIPFVIKLFIMRCPPFSS